MTTSPTTVNPTDPCGELLRAFGSCSMEAKIDAVLNIGSFHQRMAEQAIRDEVAMLCGRYRSRDKPHQGRYQRWGSNPGSIRLCGQRVPIRVPRVQDKQTNQARSLQSYRRLHNATVDDKKLTEVLLMGVSQRNYQRAAQEYADAFGLSATSVRRRFIQRGQQILQDFFERRLDKLDLVGLWIDGKHFAKYQVVVAMGLTLTGEKVVLGFAQVPSENTEAIEGLLEDLIARGLRLGEGLLCMVDGSKGIHAAVRKVFGKYALVQRCCWHKQENVVAHVKKEDQPRYRKRLQSAYRKPTYAAAKAALNEPPNGVAVQRSQSRRQSGRRHGADTDAASAGPGPGAGPQLAYDQQHREPEQCLRPPLPQRDTLDALGSGAPVDSPGSHRISS